MLIYECLCHWCSWWYYIIILLALSSHNLSFCSKNALSMIVHPYLSTLKYGNCSLYVFKYQDSIKLKNLFEFLFYFIPIIPPIVVPNVPKNKPNMVVFKISCICSPCFLFLYIIILYKYFLVYCLILCFIILLFIQFIFLEIVIIHILKQSIKK